MPKNPHANFTPVLDGYSGIGAFRFWCQTALPLTYDDSLSYYELLCKVVNYLNHTIEDLTTVEDNTSALATAYTQLQDYVNDYFDDLDIEAELRNVLDAMAEDGTLDELLAPIVAEQLPGVVDDKIDDVVADQIDDAVAGQIGGTVAQQLPALVESDIPDEVTSWLTENVDPVGSAVVVDSSLTISGAAADAKVTGDSLGDLNELLDDIGVPGKNLLNPYTISENGTYIKTDGTVGHQTNLHYSDFIKVQPSSVYYVNKGLGSSTYPTVVQFDSNKNVISDSAIFRSSTSAFNFTTSATTEYIVVNFSNAQVDNIMVSDIDSTFEAYKLVGSGNVSNLHLYSDNNIYYDGNNLLSKSTISLVTMRGVVNFGNSVTVGAGKYLYYNAIQKTLFASTTLMLERDIYFVCVLDISQDNFTSLMNNVTMIEYDAIFNKVKIFRTSNMYLYDRGTFYSLAGENVELSSNTAHFILYYSISDNAFYVTSTYGNVKNDDIVVMEAYAGNYNAICPVKIINGYHSKANTKFYTFGDSLTWYNGQNFTWGEHEGETCYGFQSYLARYCRMDFLYNYGQSGKTTPQICDIILNNITNLVDESNVFIMGGDNDDRLGVAHGTIQPVGGTFNTQTVAGALQNAIEALLTSKPTIRIILMTQPIGWTYRNSRFERVDDQIPQIYRDIAKLYGLPLIDLWAESGINEYTRTTYYADPPTNTSYFYHPNNKGWERISRIICNEVMKT